MLFYSMCKEEKQNHKRFEFSISILLHLKNKQSSIVLLSLSYTAKKITNL